MDTSTLDKLIRLADIFRIPSYLFARSIRNQKTNLIVLLYHDVVMDQFELQMQFIDSKFEFVTIEDVLRCIAENSFPSNPQVLVTFDDGFKSFHSDAFPIIDNNGIPVINYVTSGIIDSEFWISHIDKKLVIPGVLGCGPTSLKSQEYPMGREVAKKMGFDIFPGMSTSELNEVWNHPKVTIGAHSVSHPNLPSLSIDESRKEVIQCREDLKEKTGKTANHFAYPFGFCSEREMQLLRDAGYLSGATTTSKWVQSDSTPYSLPRVGTGPAIGSVSWLKYRIGRKS